MRKKQRSNRKEPANYEKIAAIEFSTSKGLRTLLTATVLSLEPPAIDNNSIRRAS